MRAGDQGRMGFVQHVVRSYRKGTTASAKKPACSAPLRWAGTRPVPTEVAHAVGRIYQVSRQLKLRDQK